MVVYAYQKNTKPCLSKNPSTSDTKEKKKKEKKK